MWIIESRSFKKHNSVQQEMKWEMENKEEEEYSALFKWRGPLEILRSHEGQGEKWDDKISVLHRIL